MELDLNFVIFFFSSIIIILVMTRNLRVIDDIEFLGVEVNVNLESLNTALAGLSQIEI
jgi:hypothetical protein